MKAIGMPVMLELSYYFYSLGSWWCTDSSDEGYNKTKLDANIGGKKPMKSNSRYISGGFQLSVVKQKPITCQLLTNSANLKP